MSTSPLPEESPLPVPDTERVNALLKNVALPKGGGFTGHVIVSSQEAEGVIASIRLTAMFSGIRPENIVDVFEPNQVGINSIDGDDYRHPILVRRVNPLIEEIGLFLSQNKIDVLKEPIIGKMSLSLSPLCILPMVGGRVEVVNPEYYMTVDMVFPRNRISPNSGQT